MLTALTRAASSSLGDCALSFLDRTPIDIDLARRQHRAYEDALRRLGARVVSLPPEPNLPDAVFVEDTAVVVDEIAVMTAPRLESRCKEVASVAAALGRFRQERFIDGAATLAGGDVMRVGRTVFAGLSARSNRDGVAQLAACLEPFGYRVVPVEFEGCLHLKSACCYIGSGAVLANRVWVDTAQLDGLEVIDVAPDEPAAANALCIADHVLLPASYPATRARLERREFRVHALDVSELRKAEAGVTCRGIIFEGA